MNKYQIILTGCSGEITIISKGDVKKQVIDEARDYLRYSDKNLTEKEISILINNGLEAITYTDINDDIMEWEDVLAQVKENPFSTNPDESVIFGSDGTEYSIKDIADILNIKLQDNN